MREFNNGPPNGEAALHYASRHGWAVLPMHGKSSTTTTACTSPHVIPTSSSNGTGPKTSAWPAASPPAPTSLKLMTRSFRSGRFRCRRAGRVNVGRNNAIRRAALVLRVCRTSQPLLFLGRMEFDRPCSCAAASARATVAQRSESAASAARAD